MKMFSGGIVVSMSNNISGQYVKAESDLNDNSGFPLFDGLTSGVPTRTTPTLTPTTLRNIEQAFIELQSISPSSQHQHQAGFVPPVVQPSTHSNTQAIGLTSYTTLDTKSWHGGTTTVSSVPNNNVDPYPFHLSNTSTEDSVPSPPARRSAGGRRPKRDDKVTPEEEERRRVRRERNKLAAARCRKRRLDHTNLLVDETDGLESKKQGLQNEIQMLQSQKEELEYILETHKANGCKMLKSAYNFESAPVSVDVKRDLVSPREVRSVVRPNSLPIPSVTDVTGISITTPSSAVQGFSLDSLLDTGMGFTPVSSCALTTPVSGSGLTTPVSTALITPSMPESCASQQRNLNGSDLSSPDAVPPKLVTL